MEKHRGEQFNHREAFYAFNSDANIQWNDKENYLFGFKSYKSGVLFMGHRQTV